MAQEGHTASVCVPEDGHGHRIGSSVPRIETIETAVIGAGQAGLATSYVLTELGEEHVVLERTRVADTWRSRRWDSFTLVGPNWTCTLPGIAYTGPDPDGFMGKGPLVAFFEGYARSFDAPVREGVEVRRLRPDDRGYLLETQAGAIRARNVVVATGAYQRPRIPDVAAKLDPRIAQVHSEAYRQPAQLPEGGVLVVGAGQSGAQIAEELREAGRDVILASSSAAWYPRRYRGRDNSRWREEMGYFFQTVDTLASPHDRLRPVPMMTGRGGGHDINLRTLAGIGVRVTGRVTAIDGTCVRFADGVAEAAARGDEAARKLMRDIDAFIARSGIAAPADDGRPMGGGPPIRPVTEFDLVRERIGSVIWCTGYAFDWSWVEVAGAFDDDAYPVQRQGVTPWPGLYFLGLHWMHTRGSGIIWGVGRDATHIAEHIAARG